jgi:hypothetical protein
MSFDFPFVRLFGVSTVFCRYYVLALSLAPYRLDCAYYLLLLLAPPNTHNVLNNSVTKRDISTIYFVIEKEN